MKMVESTRLYFAYGAMLSPRTLERRGIRPVGPVLRAKLPNYRLVFDHRAGFGTLVATENKHEVGERERGRGIDPSQLHFLSCPSDICCTATAIDELLQNYLIYIVRTLGSKTSLVNGLKLVQPV